MTAPVTTRLAIVLLYVAVVAANVFRAEITEEALAFHTRDYPFYLQFASKLLDQRIAPVYSMNPDGYNVLFFNGTDGAAGLHQSVHLEPLKYIYGVVYYLTGSAHAIYLFIAAVFFLPLLYLAWRTPLDSSASRSFTLLLALLYAIYPASLGVSAFDLRPFVFLAPFFALVMLAVEFDRSPRETVPLFAGMFLAREEALIFGLIVIGYAFVRLWDSPRRRSVVVSMSLIWAVGFVAIASYFWWTGYRNTLTARFGAVLGYIAGHSLLALGAAVVLLALAGTVLWALRKSLAAWPLADNLRARRWLQVGIYCTVFPPLAMQFVRERSEMFTALDTTEIARVLSTARFGFCLAAVVVLFVILWRLTTAAQQRTALLTAAAAGVAVSAAVAVSAPFGYRARMAILTEQSHSAAAVLALRNETDKYTTEILTDYATFQAFADYQHVYAFERLPSYVAGGAERFFPANHDLVQRLIDRRVEYVVISRASLEEIDGLMAKSRVRRTTEFANADFVGMHLWRN